MEPKLPPRETVELVRACEKRVCSTQEHFGCIYGDDGCIDCVERLQADYDATIELLLKKSEERACTQQEVEKLQRRLSDAMKYIPHSCECCEFQREHGRCAQLPEGDEFSADNTEGFERDDCEHWELRLPKKIIGGCPMNNKIGVTITKKTQQQVTWELLKTLADESRIKELLAVGDELQVELKTGEAVTFQLADLCMKPAGRPCFVLKDCMKDEKPMNKTSTNKGGWEKSFMREWLNETIFHQLPDELQAIIMPRVIKQKLGSKTVETVDKLWLPSHTEMFGADADWAPADTEDAQLALYQTERSRVKECAGRGTWWYWERSPYEYINGNEEAGAYITNQAGALYGAGDNALGALFGMATENKSESQQMTEDEVAIFNYIYKTQGKDAAHAYYEYLTSDLNYRQRKEEEEYWADYAKESPVGSSVFSVLTAPMKGLSYIGQAADYLGSGTIDQNAAYNRFSYANNAIRNEVSKTIEDSGSWGKVGSFAYNTGMSMADFLLNTAITGGFSGGGAISEAAALAIMGTGAAADATIAAKDRGLTDTQSFWLGTIAGAAEIATEKLSIDALLKGKWEDDAIKYILKNTFTEGSEEVGSDVINGIADVLIAKDKSEWQTSIDAYMAEGMTQQEAFNKAFLQQLGQMGLDFLGGAISGGVMSGTGAGIGTLQKNATYQKTGATIRKFGDETLQAIIDTGLQADVNTEAHKLAAEVQQKLQNGKTVSDAEIGKLFAAAGKAVDTAQTTNTEGNAIDLPTAEQAEQAQEEQPQTVTAQAQQTAEMQQPGVLPTEEQAEKQQRMNKATTELERSAIEFDVDEDTLGRVQRIAQIVGRDVVFYSAADNSNGYYDSKSGTLHINAQSQNPVAQIISHELTHSIEQTGDYAKLQTGYSYGVTPESYVKFKQLQPLYDTDGNGSFKQDEVTAALTALVASNDVKAALWQMANKSWKPRNNPFSTSIGQSVYDALNAETDGGILLPETSTSGGIVLPMY